MGKKQSELPSLSIEELVAKKEQLDRDLFAMRNERAVQKKMEKPHLLKEKRKEKARVLTFLHQKQLRGIES